MPWTCEQLSRRLVEVEDGAVGPVEGWVARVHLRFCVQCRRLAVQLRLTRDLLGRSRPSGPVDSASRQRAMKSFEDLVRGRGPE